LKKTRLTSEEAEAAALDKQELCRTAAHAECEPKASTWMQVMLSNALLEE